MNRVAVLINHPKRTLGALAAALLAVGVAVGTGANFTAQAANPGNMFAAGSLSIANTPTSAILTASNMVPGTSTNGTVDIENTGTVAGTFSLARTDLTNSDAANPMAAKLDLVVTDCGTFVGATAPTCGDGDDVEEYNGTLAAMSSSVGLGTYNPAVKHRYRFVVTLNASTSDAYQGGTSSATFQWNAVSN
jgi:hypothetical protein